MEANMIETATFALGCFWGVEHHFSRLPGVISTRVGYSGGTKSDPTYQDIGDHSESIEIQYDSGVISYATLLKHFWDQHTPTEQGKRQYASAIFTHNDEQMRLALESRDREQQKYGQKIITRIEPAGRFYPAEEYHQKYYDKIERVRSGV
jgi:peptide-methionine (S)-S-oxide reductase